MIRRATTADVPAIGKIVNDCAEYGLMLHRSLAYLYEHVRDFHVAIEHDGNDGKEGKEGNNGETAEHIIGVCGLNIIWANIAEVYSLAVAPAARGHGVGRRLVQACIEEARQLGIRRLMALTYEKDFFLRLGFQVVDRQDLPLKVWSECVRCSRNQACDEIAMIRIEESVPELSAPPPEAPPAGSYEVPVVLGIRRGAPEPRPPMDEPQ